MEMALRGQIQEKLTFLHEDALPALPLPSLDQTCEKLVKSVEPFCHTEQEYREFKQRVDNFRRGVGTGFIVISGSVAQKTGWRGIGTMLLS